MAIGLVALAVLALVRIGMARLDIPEAIGGDGIRRGRRMPPADLTDLRGGSWTIPSGAGHWQLVLFADHSLTSFPSLVDGLHRLRAAQPDLEVLLVSKSPADVTAAGVGALGLNVPILCVDRRFYARCGVRAMPFAIVVDDEGVTRMAGLVNREEVLAHVWRLATSLPAPPKAKRNLVRASA